MADGGSPEQRLQAEQNRELTADEEMVYLMGHFEYGEPIEEIAAGHKRTPEFVAGTIKRLREDNDEWIEYFKKKRRRRV